MYRDKDLYTEFCSDLDELAETVTSYINFCEDLIISRRLIKFFQIINHGCLNLLKNIIDERTISFNQRKFNIVMINFKNKV